MILNSIELSLTVTPAGIPIGGAVVILALCALLVWDSLRLPAGAWYRWFMPIGFLFIVAAIVSSWYWVIAIGAVVMGIGMSKGKMYRQKNDAFRGF
ncbi:hypothetical protein [Streptomyces sp. SID11385]|uniref:hypothetical protein n=1 Tax=Streptomyces sp. SID11385 TaxID=2706031 RepID=UPI0013CB5340|nr:hypothetical protein [Streptomyces sp. SID11385]NEA41928.1 hypothetical protein [Streptomyces sp. SID11385]